MCSLVCGWMYLWLAFCVCRLHVSANVCKLAWKCGGPVPVSCVASARGRGVEVCTFFQFFAISQFSAIFLQLLLTCPPCVRACWYPDIAEQWSMYTRCNGIDINGPSALHQWLQSCAFSPFQERVLFLITQPTFGGDVERSLFQAAAQFG